MLRRTRWVFGFLQILLVMLAGRCAVLQLWRGEDLARRQERSLQHKISTLSTRGSIRTRDGLLLAHDVTTWRVGLDPQAAAGDPARVRPHERERRVRHAVRLVVASGIALRADRRTLEEDAVQRLVAGKRFVRLGTIESERVYREFIRWRGRAQPSRRAGSVASLAECVTVVPALRRAYPQGSLAAQVVGMTTPDRVGLFGIERAFDGPLRGIPGVHVVERSRRKRLATSPEREVAPIDGSDLVLTLDARIQALLEQLLEETRRETQAQAACGVVMDPRDGAILALASAPLLDRANFSATPPIEKAKRRLQTTQLTYEPGSIIKGLILAEAYLAEIDPKTRLTEGEKEWVLPYRTITDETLHGPLDLEGCVVHSSNIGMARLGRLLGKDTLRRCLDRFRLGRRSDFELYEEQGQLPSLNHWIPSTTLSVPIGYALSTNALQIARAYSAIANGGILVTPHLVLECRDRCLQPTPGGAERGRRIVPADVSARVRRILRRVVTEGTGKFLAGDTLPFAGKTGTARRSENGTYPPGQYVSTFVGFVPWDEPTHLALVVVDRPQGGQFFASQVAGPVVRSLLGRVGGESDQAIRAQIEAALAAAVRDSMIPVEADEGGETMDAAHEHHVGEDRFRARFITGNLIPGKMRRDADPGSGRD